MYIVHVNITGTGSCATQCHQLYKLLSLEVIGLVLAYYRVLDKAPSQQYIVKYREAPQSDTKESGYGEGVT